MSELDRDRDNKKGDACNRPMVVEDAADVAPAADGRVKAEVLANDREPDDKWVDDCD